MTTTDAYRRLSLVLAGALVFGLAIGARTGFAEGKDNGPRRFILNEDMIRGLTTPPDSQACDPGGVLRDLFKQIGPVARIFPTENYYYFSFFRGGKSYSASLRLALDNRDKGIVQYDCYETSTNWLKPDPGAGIYKELSLADGVSVRRVGDLEYEIEFQGATVKFLLNTIDQTPDPAKLQTGEKFAGRIFDDSGLVFDLVYNTGEKAFYFVLDARNPATDAFAKIKEKVLLHRRTGFIFFEDVSVKRLVLIAVHAAEVRKNTPYDGPFDQLPENFYEQTGFWKYVYEAHPELIGQLTPGGTKIGSTLVYSISSYREYATQKDLSFIDACMRKHLEGAKLILCLTGQLPRRRRS